MPHDIIMPALGMAQETGKIISWLKQPGDAVTAGDVIMEVETDKSVMEVEAQANGFLTRVTAKAGDDVPVGKVVAVIAETPDVSEDDPAPAADTQSTGLSASVQSGETPSAGERISTMAMAPGTPRDNGPIAATPQDATAKAAVPPSPDGRILASPKARRLAREQGLDLARLVAHGTPQPYHVADLETLRGLPSRTEIPETRPVSMPLHVLARVPASGCDGFIDWMKQDGDIDIAPRLIWLRFATAAYREAAKTGDAPLLVETSRRQVADGRFVDADRSRLSQPLEDDGETAPALLLRDFTGTPIISASASTHEAPVMTIGRERDEYVIGLDYRADQLDETAAFDFVDGFAARLADPLRHLV
jgi:hypothetical protein